jgi:hypothetical protein
LSGSGSQEQRRPGLLADVLNDETPSPVPPIPRWASS